MKPQPYVYWDLSKGGIEYNPIFVAGFAKAQEVYKYVTQSAWPLLAMAFVGISVKSKPTSEKE